MASTSDNDTKEEVSNEEMEMNISQFLLESLGYYEESTSTNSLFTKKPWEDSASKEQKKLYKKYKNKGAFSSIPDPFKHMFGNFLNPFSAQNEFDVIQKEYRELLVLKKASKITDCVVHYEPKDEKFAPWSFWTDKFETMKNKAHGIVVKEDSEGENENSYQSPADDANEVEIHMGNGADNYTEPIDEENGKETIKSTLKSPSLSSSNTESCPIKVGKFNPYNFLPAPNTNSDDESQSSLSTQQSGSSRVLSMEEF